MAQVTDADRECFTRLLAEQKRALWAPGGQEHPDEAAAGAIAAHREAAVREALDARDKEWYRAAGGEYEGIQSIANLVHLFGKEQVPEAVLHEVWKRDPCVIELRNALLAAQTSTQSALDAQARRVFAALCEYCAEGTKAWRGENDGEWRHDKGDEGASVWCEADLARDELDPDGRLAGPEEA